MCSTYSNVLIASLKWDNFHFLDSTPLALWLLRDSFAAESQCLPPPQTRISPITLLPLWHFCAPKSNTFFNLSWCSLGNLSTRKKSQKRTRNACSCIPDSRLHANKEEQHFRSDSSPSFSSSSRARIRDKRNPSPSPNSCRGGKKPSNVR